MKKYLVVTAGGSGTRMGASCPKQFLELDGKAILQLTIESFLQAVPDLNVVVVLPQNHIDGWKQYCYDHHFDCRQTLVAGGITRYHSVKNGLDMVPDGCLAAVHDGVRPLLSPELIRSLFETAESKGSAVPVTPCVETMKVLDPSTMEPTGASVDRSVLFGVQTPQIFLSEKLKAAFLQPFSTSFTDESSVMEAFGMKVSYVLGERTNLKITTPEDLELARAILASRRSR